MSVREIDISSEEYRVYTYPSGARYRINAPVKLVVIYDDSGAINPSHRVVDADGVTHRPERGWLCVSWSSREGEPGYVA